MNGILRSGTSLQIETGGIDIPDLDLAPVGRPCEVAVRLEGIYYSPTGDDIGSYWRFEAVVHGSYWTSGRVTLTRGHSLPVGSEIARWRTPAGCGLHEYVDFLVRAREYDLLRDDIGMRPEVTFALCRPEATSIGFVMPLPVGESPDWRRLLTGRATVALLAYVFRIEARCVA
jgi:hypothetical protein